MMRGGRMVRVHHLNCATMCPPFAAAMNAPGFFVAHVLAIETDGGVVLVDTGIGNTDIAAPRDRLGLQFLVCFGPVLQPAETALAQLQALGFSARDVRHVLVTHLDPDHAGGLADFPTAQVHVLERERTSAFGPLPFIHRMRYRKALFSHQPRWVDYEAVGERWFGFEAVRLLEGMKLEMLLVPLPGHTLGHCGVAVRDGEHWLLHAGDAYFHRDELLGHGAPLVLETTQRVMAMDHAMRLANRERLVELAHQGTVKIFCSHDPTEWQALANPPR